MGIFLHKIILCRECKKGVVNLFYYTEGEKIQGKCSECGILIEVEKDILGKEVYKIIKEKKK